MYESTRLMATTSKEFAGSESREPAGKSGLGRTTGCDARGVINNSRKLHCKEEGQWGGGALARGVFVLERRGIRCTVKKEYRGGIVRGVFTLERMGGEGWRGGGREDWRGTDHREGGGGSD